MCFIRNITSLCICLYFFFFFNDTATTEIYTLSLHDALPISPSRLRFRRSTQFPSACQTSECRAKILPCRRSEEHTSELQSLTNLVCRLLLEKKKKKNDPHYTRENASRLLCVTLLTTSSLMKY